MAGSTALFDANVLYPAPLRDLLMHLALTDLFQARWSDAIHDEWIRNVLEDRPDLTKEQLERTRRLMNAHARDALVTDYEALIPDMILPDPDDRHVLAAAIKGGADVIVTNNLKDFPAETLARYGIEAQHPDAFVTALIELDALAVVGAEKPAGESAQAAGDSRGAARDPRAAGAGNLCGAPKRVCGVAITYVLQECKRLRKYVLAGSSSV